MARREALSLHADVRFRAVAPEGVLVDQRTAEVIVVNGVGLRVLELIRDLGGRQAIVDALIREYDAPPRTIAAEVDAFLDELDRLGVLGES